MNSADLNHLSKGEDHERSGERMKGILVAVTGAALMVGLAVGAMSMLTSPDSWVMKAANQAMLDQQQAVATGYLISMGD